MSTITVPRTTTSAVGDQASRDDEPVLVKGTHAATHTGPVVVALDDDGNAGPLLRHGCRLAALLGVPLRAAYVWSDCRPPDCAHHRRCHRDLGEASRMLGALLDNHLTMDVEGQMERDVLHAADPASALITLSTSASMLVVGSSSDSPRTSVHLGGTTRALLGRTRCPVMVVPRHTASRRPFW